MVYAGGSDPVLAAGFLGMPKRPVGQKLTGRFFVKIVLDLRIH